MATPQQLSQKIDDTIAKLPQIMASAQLLAINEIVGLMSRRIFNEGKRTDGSSIGEYSTKDTLVGAKSFRNTGNANAFFESDDLGWVNIKGRSLAKLAGGYKKLRELQGLETNFVNLDYRGNVKNSLDVGTVNGNVVIGLNNSKTVAIVEGLDGKYGQVFYPQQQEIDIGVELASQYIIEQVTKEIQSWS